jgi:hypothetical protein
MQGAELDGYSSNSLSSAACLESTSVGAAEGQHRLDSDIRPPQPSLNNGPVQRRVRRAFIVTGKPVLSTSQIVEWSHPRPGTNRHHACRSVRGVCERYCVRVGRSNSGSGRHKNIQHTVRYTELAPDRFRDFWR